jgi:hypothetical protein
MFPKIKMGPKSDIQDGVQDGRQKYGISFKMDYSNV